MIDMLDTPSYKHVQTLPCLTVVEMIIAGKHGISMRTRRIEYVSNK